MKKSKTANIIISLVFLSVGIILFGNNLKLWNINTFFNGWWVLFIIVPSVIVLFRDGNKISSLTSIIIGILLLFAYQDIIKWSITLKLILLSIFISIILSLVFNRKNIKCRVPKIKDNTNNYLALFSGRNIVVENQKNNRFSCISILGGLDLDLSDKKIKEDIIINCVSVFGETSIKTPSNVSIKSGGIPIIGGIEEKTLGRGDKSPTIYIKYVCLFGEIEVR